MDLYSAVLNWIEKLPYWIKAVFLFSIVMSLYAMGRAWDEPYFVPGFIGNFAAASIHIVIVACSLFFAWLGAVFASGITQRKWFGVIVGIALFVVFSFVGNLARELPGVGWRIEAQRHAVSYPND
tara:strand:+ start:42 stop:416 length:375 start_codon:yes stop_codon:yes gene_type:complete